MEYRNNGLSADLLMVILIISTVCGSCFRKQMPEKQFDWIKTGDLISPPENMPVDDPTRGAYYTTLVRMKEIEGFPYKYALYFSTDHTKGKGGIWLYLCNGDITQKEHWISYDRALEKADFDYLKSKPAGNPVFVDTLKGTQTETPFANVIGNRVYMSYHNHLGIKDLQATMMAISDDGVNFQRIYDDDRAIILPPRNHLNHTGYFRWGENKFREVNFKFVGYSLLKGTDDYRSGMWGSDDAIHWQQIERFNSSHTNLSMQENDKHLVWHGLDPTSVRQVNENEYVALIAGSTIASGYAERVKELYEVFLAPDGRTIRRMSTKVLSVSKEGLDDEELDSPCVIFEGDSVKMVYVGTTGSGKRNTVMGAAGIYNPHAELPPELPPHQQQAHFYSQEDFDNDRLKYGR